ncbi:uncharacterized protein [Montipora foliosa]|uniref:uncharacterized protein isoform X1 n=1 Tax=Montipora foliosa TaxID=591990 RepID=UPI0035F205F0
MSNSISAFYLQMVVFVVSREIIGIENTLGSRSGDDIIKDCNGILYRLMIDSGEPPFPETACDIKQKVIHCFERSNGSGHLLDCDRFLLVQSSIVDEALMCPGLNYKKLQENIQNSTFVKRLFTKYQTVARHSNSSSEDCAVDIHQSCEKKIFEQMVVNHYPWPKTTKWRNCYEDAVRRRPCPAAILQNYSSLQEHFGERLRALEYLLGLFGIFMNDRNQQPCK